MVEVGKPSRISVFSLILAAALWGVGGYSDQNTPSVASIR
jgi:hypothetical protein